MRASRMANVRFIFTAHVDSIVPQLRDQLVGNVIHVPTPGGSPSGRQSTLIGIYVAVWQPSIESKR